MGLLSNISLKLSLLGRFWHEKINGQFFRLNIIFIFTQFVFIFFKFNELPPQVPLFYSLPWGENRLSTSTGLFLFPIFSIIIVLLNNVFAAFLLGSTALLSRLLVIFSFIFTLLSSIALFQIILLVS